MIVPEEILKIVPGFQITGTNRGMVLLIEATLQKHQHQYV